MCVCPSVCVCVCLSVYVCISVCVCVYVCFQAVTFELLKLETSFSVHIHFDDV